MGKFKIVVDDRKCEDLAIRWQCYEIGRLNDILKENNVEDPKVREAILTEFFFDLAVRLDGSDSGIEFKGSNYRPRLVFEEPGSPAKLHVSDAYDLHDYTHSDIFELRGEDE